MGLLKWTEQYLQYNTLMWGILKKQIEHLRSYCRVQVQERKSAVGLELLLLCVYRIAILQG